MFLHLLIKGVDHGIGGPEYEAPAFSEHPAYLAVKRWKILNEVHRLRHDHSIEALIFAGNMKDAQKWAAKGFDSVAYSLDAGVLINAYQALIRDFRSAD